VPLTTPLLVASFCRYLSITRVTDPTAVPTPGRFLHRGGFYASSNVWFTHKRYAMFMHDPANPAQAAQGQRSPYTVEAVWQHFVVLPWIPDPQGGSNGLGVVTSPFPNGIAYDVLDSKLYMLIPGAYPVGDGNPHSVVAVFSVSR
jgi:hypothetical protein